MRLHTAGSFLLTDLDCLLKDQDKSLHFLWVTLTGCDEFKASRNEGLHDRDSSILDVLVDAEMTVHEESDCFVNDIWVLALTS